MSKKFFNELNDGSHALARAAWAPFAAMDKCGRGHVLSRTTGHAHAHARLDDSLRINPTGGGREHGTRPAEIALSSKHGGQSPPYLRGRIALVVLLALLPLAKAGTAAAPLYVQNFENLKEGDPPEEIQILDGEFSVKKIDDNMLLEMGPDPLKASGILFGPGDKNEYTVSARIKTSATGKRSPEFGLGSCGPNQFKLWVMPATGELQLLSGDDTVAKIPYKWESGTWTKFKLRVAKNGDNKFKIEGKAWADGKDEPKAWQISWEDPETPRPGRAGLYSTPYAGTPTEFDDIVVEPNSK